MHISQVQLDATGIEILDARVADCRQDTPQIGIAGKERRLDQGRMGHGVGHLEAFVGRATTFDPDGDELGGSFTVPHQRMGQMPGHVSQRGQQGLALGIVQ
ncbi:hypothetical protein RZS08_30355, partial [Arthrospira platensis SPKY1]|nr:hypothetical protein [Arthrospira platensis SPKY1]